MVRVDANVVGLQVESILAVFHMFQFVLVQIRPSPQPGVDHVGETFTSGHLKHTVVENFKASSFHKSAVT